MWAANQPTYTTPNTELATPARETLPGSTWAADRHHLHLPGESRRADRPEAELGRDEGHRAHGVDCGAQRDAPVAIQTAWNVDRQQRACVVRENLDERAAHRTQLT